MSARRLRALVRRVIAEVRRDRPSLALLFIAPIVVTGLLTFILREAEAPPVRVVLAPERPARLDPVTPLVAAALSNEGMDVAGVPDAATARQRIEAGTADVAVVLPAPGDGRLTVITLGLDPAGEAAQVRTVGEALARAMAAASGIAPQAVERQTVHGTPSDDPMVPFAPAVVAFFLYFFVYLLTGVSFLRERTGGTLERLMATPVTRGEVVAGYALGFGLFATLQVVLVLGWALGSIAVPQLGPLPPFSLGLGIPVAGSPLLAFLVVVLLALGAVSLGIFLSTFARTELQVIQFIPVVLVPQFLLSGVLFPVSTLPGVLQPLVALMPLGYAVDALRQVFLRGADLSASALRFDLAVLAAVAVLFAFVASLTIRRDVA